MAQPHKLKLHINGMRYAVVTQEEPTYVAGLAQEIHQKVREYTQINHASLNESLVLIALSYLDDLKKSEANADNLRNQVTTYAEESSKARFEVADLHREIEKLQRQLAGKNSK